LTVAVVASFVVTEEVKVYDRSRFTKTDAAVNAAKALKITFELK